MRTRISSRWFLLHPLRGFTMIELLMSISIMVVMTTVLLAKYPETAVRLTLANTTHTLALLFREAQVRGSAIDSVAGSVGGYGVFLDLATSSNIILFNDVIDAAIPKPFGLSVGDGLYQTATPDETATLTRLPQGFSVGKICLPTTPAATSYACNTAVTPDVQTLTVSFTRPSPEAHIYINGDTATDYASACIQMYSPKTPEPGHIRSVYVYRSGMITTSVTPCD